jgi:hypothetical protein
METQIPPSLRRDRSAAGRRICNIRRSTGDGDTYRCNRADQSTRLSIKNVSPARTTVLSDVAFRCDAAFKRVLDLFVSAVVRKEEQDIARLYEGCSWCDSTEHDLNHDVMTARRGARRS